MSHIWISYVTHVNESCHTYEPVERYTCTVGKSHAHEQIMSHVWSVASHTWRSHGTHMNESRHMYECKWHHMYETAECREWEQMFYICTYMCRYMWRCMCRYMCLPLWARDMAHIWTSQVTRMNESRHTHPWVVSHTWMGLGAHAKEPCHTHERVTSRMWMCRKCRYVSLFLVAQGSRTRTNHVTNVSHITHMKGRYVSIFLVAFVCKGHAHEPIMS